MQPPPSTEKRSGPDILVNLIKTLSIVCCLLLIGALLLLDLAKPGIETFFDRLLDVQLRENWDQELLLSHFYLVAIMCALSLLGLIFNKMRTRRKTDRYSKTLIFATIFSIAALLFSLLCLPL
jgi:hypothetical protein